MPDVNLTISSDNPRQSYDIEKLSRRTIITDDSDPQNPVTESQWFAIVRTSWAGGRKTVKREVILNDLPAADRAAGLQFFDAVCAAAEALVTADDFKR